MPARIRDSSPEESDDDLEEQGRLNDSLLAKVKPEYLNQAIDQKQGEVKLKSLVSQLSLVKSHLKDTVILLSEVASNFAESLAEDVSEREFDEDTYIQFLLDNSTMEKLDREFRSVLDSLYETNTRTAVISDIRNRLVQGHQIRNLFETYEKRVEEGLSEYRQMAKREKFAKSKQYGDFIALVWENFSGGASVPNVKKFLPRESRTDAENGHGNVADGNGAGQGGGGGDSDDEEVEIGAQSTDFRCPLTVSILEDPYTSMLCPHSFSGEAIKDYIKSQGRTGTVECPVAGCHKRLDLSKIERDEGLARRVEAHLRRVESGLATQQNHNGNGDGEDGGGGANGATGGRTYVEMSDSDDD